MAIKKSELYSSLWKSCDELRGGMDASQYKGYVDVKVTEYSIGHGVIRGQWVVSFFIPASGICREDGKVLPWPPAKSEREGIGAMIGDILRREWVFTSSLTPA